MNIYERISAIAKEAESIPKNGYNSFSKYNYIRAVDVVGYINKLLIKHKVTVLISETDHSRTDKTVDGKNWHTTIKCEAKLICTEDPAQTTTVTYFATGADTLDKDIYKAKTGGLKYLYTQVFRLITDDFIDPEDDSKTNKNPSKKEDKKKNNPLDNLKKSLFGGMKALKYNDTEAKEFYDFHMTGKLPDEITLLDFIDNLSAYSKEFKESKL